MPLPIVNGGWWVCDVCAAEEGSVHELPEGWLLVSQDHMVLACARCVNRLAEEGEWPRK